jgi:hypothetical protein
MAPSVVRSTGGFRFQNPSGPGFVGIPGLVRQAVVSEGGC